MNRQRSVVVSAGMFAMFLLLSAVLFTGMANAHHCKGKHKNDAGCDSGGGGSGDPVADPAFAYIKPSNTSPIVVLANADGSAATQIFTGVKFTFAQEPAAWGDMSGGKVLIGDFSNLFLITYTISGGVINAAEEVMIHDRDIVSQHRANPDWSPDGSDFAFREVRGSMYLDSRARYNSDGVVEDRGDPVYEEHRAGRDLAGVDSIAWDAAGVIHFISEDPGGGYELRSLNISECNPTCDDATTVCIASTGSLSCGGAEVLGAANFQHVSVNYDSTCPGGGPHILVSGNDAAGNPMTFVLDKSLVNPMSTVTVLNLDGNDWTDHCTFVGSPGDGSEGPLHGGAIVEYDPFSGIATTLINRRGQTPDWIN